jgi:hypothetical protein
MPFDEEDDDSLLVESNKGLKKVSNQKSIFDSLPKKPTQADLDSKVKKIEEKEIGYKQRATDLALEFKKMLDDKTLPENKNIFAKDMERDVLGKLIQLAIDINNDPVEKEGMGSLSCITLLFKACLSQRDRINKLEYSLSEINKVLDKKK